MTENLQTIDVVIKENGQIIENIREMTLEEISSRPPIEISINSLTLTARQIRLWLLSKGILPAHIDAVISSLPEPQKSAVQIDWEYATIFERSNPMINQLGVALGLTTEEIDIGFNEAKTLWP